MRLVLIGWGAIGSEIARRLALRQSPATLGAVAGCGLLFPLIIRMIAGPATTASLPMTILAGWRSRPTIWPCPIAPNPRR